MFIYLFETKIYTCSANAMYGGHGKRKQK